MIVLKFVKSLIVGGLLLSFPRIVEALFNLEYLPYVSLFFANAITGLRFDLLVLSFILLPVLMFFLVFRLIHLRKITAWLPFVDFAFLCVWALIAMIYFLNFLYLNSFQDRVWIQDLVPAWKLVLTSSFLELVVSLGLAGFLFHFGVQLFKKVRKIFVSASIAELLVMFLLLMLLARGSVGQDHLRRNDCDGRPNSVMRALCLSPLYVISKIKNREFGP